MLKDSSPAQVRRHFGAAHLAKSLVWSFSDLLLAYYLFSVLGIPGERVAWLMFVFLMFGAFCDAAIGIVLTVVGASVRAMLWLHVVGSGLTALALFAQFGPDRDGLFLITGAGLFFRLAFSLYDVPQSALTSLLPLDADDSRRYVRLRTTLSAVAKLAVTSANLGLARLPESLLRSGGALILGSFGIAIMTTSTLLFRSAGNDVPAGPPRGRKRLSLTLPFGLASLLVMFLVSTTFFATLSRLVLFTPSPPGFSQFGAWLLLAFSAGTVIGPAAAIMLENKLGWRWACVILVTLGVLTGNALLLLLTAPSAAILVASAYGVGLGGTGAFLWEATSRTALDHAHRTGERVDGVVFGLVIFTIKVSIALGSLMMGPLIADYAIGDVQAISGIAVVTTVSGVVVGLLLVSRRKSAAMA